MTVGDALGYVALGAVAGALGAVVGLVVLGLLLLAAKSIADRLN